MTSREANKEATIRQYYTELNKHITNEEFDKAVKSANKILSIAPEEEKAAQCKVVSLIQASKFEEAIKFIEKSKLSQLVFEKSYSEYRLNQPEKSLKTIEDSKINPLPPNLKELKAQILYRLEKFEECFEIYKDIIKNTQDDYEDERTTNLSAVIANLSVEGSKKELPTLGETTYELTYNSGCSLAGQEKYVEAEKKMRNSEKMCREFLEEDGATEEDIQNELGIIKVQLAYCLQMQGRAKEAGQIYSEIIKSKPNDPALVAVASNNSVVINKDQNMFDSKKKIRAAMVDACEHKLTSRQKKSIALNNCLLALFTNQSDLTQLLNKFCAKYPDMEFKAHLITVSQHIRDKKYKEAADLLEEFVKKDPKYAFETKFAIVQLHLMNGNKQAAIEILKSLGDKKYSPAVVSAFVSLYLGVSDKAAASEILKEAVEWYKKNKTTAGDLTDMWRQAADFHLRGGEAETAAKSLEELLKTNPSDMKILAQLVIAYAQFDPSKAQSASKKLPALETLTTQAEIDELEATNWMMIAKAVKKKVTKSDQSPGTPGSENVQKTKKKRKRKGKLPKNCDPNSKPDPERWLKKHERTGYRKKKDRRVKEVMKGSQGTSSGQSDQFDMTKSYNLQAKSPAVAPVEPPFSGPGPRQMQRKHQQKKKKGKH